MLHDPAREDPRAREWANRECQYVQEIAQLKAELGKALSEKATAILERAQLALELNRIRRRVPTAKERK
jgi:hypothetical protein